LTAVLCDRYPLWQEAVEQVLLRVDVKVVGKATTTRGAVGLIEQRKPDLLIADVDLADDSPDSEILRSTIKRTPGLRVVVLSDVGDEQSVARALEEGVSAYVVKTAYPEDLASAVRQAFNHSVYLPTSSPAYPTDSASQATASSLTEGKDNAGLTKREVEILRLVAEGHSNAELGRMLWVTEQTVKFHLSNVYRKLHVANRTEAARWAQLHGLLPSVGDTTRTAA
jgi:DNA-binding NarL/FixJ family response regulator